MRVERLHRQHVTDSCKLHVDNKHRGDQRTGQQDRIAEHRRHIQIDQFLEPAGNDRDHEGEEKTFNRPRPQMVADFLSIPIVSAGNPSTEMPTAVARVDEIAVEPDHIRH